VSVPLVAVTVTVEDPTGVPWSTLPPPLPPLLPPPQLAIMIRQVTAISESSRLQDRRFAPPPSKKIPARVTPRLVVHHAGPSSLALWAPRVEMVSLVEPLFVTEVGLKLHVLSRGRPEHDAAEKFIVPLYPVVPVTVSMTVPLPPGLGMRIDGAAGAKRKSGCTFTVVGEEFDPV
jgi:hypothetical protein